MECKCALSPSWGSINKNSPGTRLIMKTVKLNHLMGRCVFAPVVVVMMVKVVVGLDKYHNY